MLEFMEQLLSEHQITLFLFIFASAILEYVIPPYFVDTAMVFGFFLAGAGKTSTREVFICALAGSVIGAILAYVIGSRFGRLPILTRKGKRKEKSVRLIESFFTDQGEKILIINRFVPGLRAFFLYLAGMGKMRFGTVLVYATISNILWCFLLMYAGTTAGASVDKLSTSLKGLTTAFGIPALIILSILVMVHFLRVRRERKEQDVNA
jgi:membrane protein DedA with SNARE-associated domain